MLHERKLKRLNELAQKAKKSGLTNAEKKEQQTLRNEYLKTFRQAFKNQLHNIKVVDANGDDVTPKKLKKSKKQYGYRH